MTWLWACSAELQVEWQPDSDRLPRAATCFQKIYLPRYTSFSKMRDKMVIAIECMAIVRPPNPAASLRGTALLLTRFACRSQDTD